MVSEKFNKIAEARLQAIRDTLLIKGKEYIRGDDVFHNFVQAGRIDNSHPLRALHGMFLKHYVSFQDMISDVEQKKNISLSQIDEKLGDMQVYLILAEGILKEAYSRQLQSGNSNTEQREAPSNRDDFSQPNTSINP